MLRNPKAFALSAALVGLVAVTSIVLAQTSGERPDCPGKIVCPQTGEQVCRDKCPTVDPSRPDCPGRIVCPLTGELVCQDRCPLKKDSVGSTKTEGKVPSCCATRG
jgi:hypothetical protein